MDGHDDTTCSTCECYSQEDTESYIDFVRDETVDAYLAVKKIAAALQCLSVQKVLSFVLEYEPWLAQDDIVHLSTLVSPAEMTHLKQTVVPAAIDEIRKYWTRKHIRYWLIFWDYIQEKDSTVASWMKNFAFYVQTYTETVLGKLPM